MLQMFIAEIFIYIVNTCISIKITFTLLLRMGVGASADPEFFSNGSSRNPNDDFVCWGGRRGPFGKLPCELNKLHFL